MDIEKKIRILTEKNKEVKEFDSIAREISRAINMCDSLNVVNRELYLFASPIFVKLFQFFRINEYITNKNNHLYDFVEFNYKKDMMVEILEIEEKYKKISENELNAISISS